MQLFWFLFIGSAAGALARLIVPGPRPGWWSMSITIGMLGSLLGGLLGRIGGTPEQGLAPLAMSAVGALVLLLVYHTVQGYRAHA